MPQAKNRRSRMSQNDPYAKLGGGALDQELFKKQTPLSSTHNSSLRLTTEEGEHIEDLITDLKRKFKIKTSLNEVARLGLLHIVQDFKKNGDNSLIYKVKKS